jgi:hypothetical protein
MKPVTPTKEPLKELTLSEQEFLVKEEIQKFVKLTT